MPSALFTANLARLCIVFGLLSSLALFNTAGGQVTTWPTDTQRSGNAFLPPGLLTLQADIGNSPVSLWLDKGKALWADTSTGRSCQSCHGGIETLKKSPATFPRLAANGQSLVSLEDQLMTCSTRAGRPDAKAEDDNLLALNAVLHDAAKGERIDMQAPADKANQWREHVERGAQLFTRRIGRINLACIHCHDQNVGLQMRADVISPGHPTGFPIYRMSWQRLGTIERRLRACYSGVQAALPAIGTPELRALELYMKVRANGMVLDGPSIRR